MFYILLLIAVLLICAEAYAASVNRALNKQGMLGPAWRQVYRWRWLLGVPLAVASVFVYYPMGGQTESYRIIGFPLMVAAFDGAGNDYVGPYTTVSIIANAIIWYFLVQIVLCVWALFERRFKAATG